MNTLYKLDPSIIIFASFIEHYVNVQQLFIIYLIFLSILEDKFCDSRKHMCLIYYWKLNNY